ncbi:fungal-specific transcription factor domain-containing protein [Ilyonectria robusta]|uniref:fungal-specific transcription factor domain-containing protein n=1 Tax=Ilyonectria robusta TaxID=1079257 RepID=UPI001E8E7310|nr:fungal-specific transcription factor domain-containing protein [Ilyonectria robusta]KAH8654763.1 fungal-specific transcription factor domain-containing protein [Ilyonectria robusta]
MEPPASSSLVFQTSRSGLEIKPVHRSPQACLYCRSRKVRCDVSKNGKPCMNCNLDEQECVVTKRASRRVRLLSGHSRFQACPQPNRPRRKPTRAPEPSIETITDLDTQPEEHDSCTRSDHNSPSPIILADQDDTTTEGNIGAESSGTPRGSSEATPVVDRTATDMLSSFFVKLSSDNRLEPSNTVVYCSYPFMAVSNMFYVPARDVRFLDAEECFRLPTRSILNQAVRQYFLHVHPMLPMLSEGDFWEAYYSPTPDESNKTCLLLMQAMLFASCNFLSLDSLKELGYSNVRSARASFYRKAKLFYDFGIEPCHLKTAQAALLLTFWTPPMKADSKPNTSWLMIAIENARAVKADYHSDVSNFPPQKTDDRDVLRRLWWCCIMRDRILPLGLRRSITITPAHFDFDKNLELGAAEIQAELLRSSVYDAETRTALARVTKRLLRFSVLLTDILLLLYPVKPVADTAREMQASVTSVRKHKEDLLHWHTERSTTETCRAPNSADHLHY